MIVELLMDMLQTVLTWAISPLPTHSIDIVSHLDLVVDNLGSLNYFLPIQETVTVVVAVMVLFPVFFGVNFALWCIALLRGGSSRG